MLRARAGNTIFLGLSHENVSRLKQGKPIKVLTSELGLKDGPTVFIFYGTTEAEMQRELQEAGFIAPQLTGDTHGNG